MEDLDGNAFFAALFSAGSSRLRTRAREGKWLICIPTQRDIGTSLIDLSVIQAHTLMPSKFIKNGFDILGGGTAVRDKQEIRAKLSSQADSSTQILKEEQLLDANEAPLHIAVVSRMLYRSPKQAKIAPAFRAFHNAVSSAEFVTILMNLVPNEFLTQCDNKCLEFCQSHIFLPQSMHTTAQVVQDICTTCAEALLLEVESLHNFRSNADLYEQLIAALNCYVMLWIHKSVLGALRTFHKSRDEIVSTAFSIDSVKTDLDLSPTILAQKFPQALAELSRLDHPSMVTPLDMAACLKRTADMVILDLAAVQDQNEATPQHAVNADELLQIFIHLLSLQPLARPVSTLVYLKLFNFSAAVIAKFDFFVTTYEASVMWYEDQAAKLEIVPEPTTAPTHPNMLMPNKGGRSGSINLTNSTHTHTPPLNSDNLRRLRNTNAWVQPTTTESSRSPNHLELKPEEIPLIVGLGQSENPNGDS